MKRANTLEELFSRSIELNNLKFSEFRLVPVSEVNQSNPDVINSLYKWRVKYANLLVPMKPFKATSINVTKFALDFPFCLAFMKYLISEDLTPEFAIKPRING